jgi:heavy metal sensor kinase
VTAPSRLGRAWAALATLRVRLTLWYVALLAAILLAFSAFLYASLARTLHDQVDRSLADHAQRIVDALEVQDGRVELGDAPDDQAAGMVTVAYGPTGQQLVAGGSPPPPPGLLAALAAMPRGERALRTVAVAGEEWRVLTVPVVERGRVAAVVQVARSEREVGAALRGLLSLMGVAVPLTLLVAVAGGLFLAGRALDPIDRITRAAARIGAEDLSRRLGFRGRDEVGRLAATFDDMLDRLERAFQRQRQFTADASHELRTPLALLSSQAEVALARPRPAAEYRRVLTSVHEDARRMSQLVAELLTLARADAGQEAVAREPLDLGELVAQVVEAMAPLADARGVRLRTGGVVPAVVAGDQTRLTQLLVNLVDNALTYTPAGGDVTVSVAVEGGTAAIAVADTGIGIAPEHLARVFERFYRADPARERGRGGAGLGLAISQWIARAHGGDISATSEPGRGTTFTVRLPLAPSRPPVA